MTDEILDLFPLRQCKYDSNDGIVTVHFDKFVKSWFDKIIKPKKEKIAHIDLDEIGSFIWLNCDGKNKVSDIITLTKNQFDDKDKIEERVKLFMAQLESKKFIRFYTIK